MAEVPLRVLYSFPHALERPGISTTARWQIAGLIAAGIEVTVVCSSYAGTIAGFSDSLAGVGELRQTMVVSGRRVPHRLIGVARAYEHHDRRVAALIRRRPREFDVIHTWPQACLHTARAAAAVGIPVVREVPSPHTAAAMESASAAYRSVDLPMPAGHSHRFDPDRLAREQAEFDAVDGLLVPSEYVRTSFLERGTPEAKLLPHRYGFDPSAFAPNLERVRSPGLFAVFAGRGEPSKGLHLALQAWVDSGAGEQGRFVICGTVLEAFRPYLARWLDHPSVEEAGFVTDIGRVMAEADVLVLPSFTEGSALVTFEAEGSGCVPVVSAACGAPCVHLEDGLVHQVGDVETLRDQLATLASDPALLGRLRQAGLARRPSLTWSAAAESLIAAYRLAVDRSDGSSARALPA